MLENVYRGDMCAAGMICYGRFFGVMMAVGCWLRHFCFCQLVSGRLCKRSE